MSEEIGLVRVRKVSLYCSNKGCKEHLRLPIPVSVSRQEVYYRMGWFKFIGKFFCPKCKSAGQNLEIEVKKKRRERYLARNAKK